MTDKSVENLELSLAALTPRGLIAFRKLIGAAPGFDISDVQQRVLEIAGGASTACVIDHSVKVPVSPPLETRNDTAMLVSNLLEDAGIDAGPSSGHDSLFSWLALVFFPSLCERTKSGTIKARKSYRYVLSRSSSDFYRHLVACPYWLLRQYGKSARMFLAQNASVMPEVVEQIVSRPSLIDSKGVVDVIDRLYWDESLNRPKEGFTTTTRLAGDPPPGFKKSTPKPGTLRALEEALSQLLCTYALRSMTAEDIFAKLPVEFDSWLQTT